MSESIAISTGHATFEAFIEEYAQRCDENYLVIDAGAAVNVGDSVEFALYLEDGSPVFYGAGECIEASDNGDEVDASYRYRLILGALALDEENRNVLAHILSARGVEPAEESQEHSGQEPSAEAADDDDDNALPEEPTSFIDDRSFVSDAPPAEDLAPEATSLVETNDFVSSQPSSPPSLRISSPVETAAASSVSEAPPPANEDAGDFEDPATTIGQIASERSSVPAAAVAAAPSTPPASFTPPAAHSSAPAEAVFTSDGPSVSFDDDASDSEPAAPLRFSGPPLSAPPPSEVSAVSPLPARPESGLRRITMTPSWSPVAEPSESMGPSTGLFAYANGVLPISNAPARPRNTVARVLFAHELLALAPAAPVVDEDNATSEIDIGSL
jgi:hypothetical protein